MASKEQTVKVINQHGTMGWVLFAAWAGAAIYFYQQDPGFWGLIVSILKATVWPAYVLYHGLGLLGV